MYSICTQNRETIYYRPELEKLYIQERNLGSGPVFNIRMVATRIAGVDDND